MLSITEVVDVLSDIEQGVETEPSIKNEALKIARCELGKRSRKNSKDIAVKYGKILNP